MNRLNEIVITSRVAGVPMELVSQALTELQKMRSDALVESRKLVGKDYAEPFHFSNEVKLEMSVVFGKEVRAMPKTGFLAEEIEDAMRVLILVRARNMELINEGFLYADRKKILFDEFKTP